MNDRLNGADHGAPDGTDPQDEAALDAERTEQMGGDADAPDAKAPDKPAPGPTSGGRFGIRRSRTRAEERIEALDTSSVRLTEELDAARTRAEAAEAELAEAKIGWQRTAADFQNYRRRTEQERADLAAMASEGLLRKVLAIADDFDRAIGHAPSDPAAAAWVEGVAAIDRKLRLLLESEGVRAIEAMGTPFDPRQHEAIIHEATTDAPDGTVIKELQKGYEINGRVLRPALVAVADNTGTTTSSDGADPAS
jgi:molecular chaperone GrpE